MKNYHILFRYHISKELTSRFSFSFAVLHSWFKCRNKVLKSVERRFHFQTFKRKPKLATNCNDVYDWSAHFVTFQTGRLAPTRGAARHGNLKIQIEHDHVQSGETKFVQSKLDRTCISKKTGCNRVVGKRLENKMVINDICCVAG